MPMTSRTATAKADGTCTVNISPDKSGIQWTVGQTTVETNPFRGTAQCTTRFNGRYVTSSAVLPATAGGSPAINLQAMDVLSFDMVGMTLGDVAVVTIYYTESKWGTDPNADVV